MMHRRRIMTVVLAAIAISGIAHGQTPPPLDRPTPPPRTGTQPPRPGWTHDWRREDRYRRSPARSSPDSPLDQPGSNWALVRVGRNSAQITETSRFLTTAVPLSNQVGWVPVSAFAFKAAFVAPSLHVAVTGLTKVIIRRFVGTFAVVTNSHPRGSLRPGLDLSCRGQRGWWHRLPAYARDQSYPLP